MLISKLELGSANKFWDTSSSPNESGIKNCENVFKHCDLQRRLGNCFNKDFGSNSWSFSGRKPHSRISFVPLHEKNGRLVNTAKRSNNTRQRRDLSIFCLNEKLAIENFPVDKLGSYLQSFCKPVIIGSCQKILPKYLSTSSPVRSHWC